MLLLITSFDLELRQNCGNAVWRDAVEVSGSASYLVVPLWFWEYLREQGSSMQGDL